MSDSATSSSSSALAQLGNLFLAPGKALDYADRHPGQLWLPWVLTTVLSAAFTAWVVLTMNIAAWRTAMIHAAAAHHPEAASRFAAMVAHVTRGDLLARMVGGTVIVMGILVLILALYFFLADKLFSADSRGYSRWLSFTAWTGLPVCIGVVASMISWALSGHGGNITSVNVTTLNTLFFHLPVTSRYFKLAQFSIMQFWVIGLMVFGLKRWCRHGTGKALGIALVPYIIYYGIIFLI